MCSTDHFDYSLFTVAYHLVLFYFHFHPFHFSSLSLFCNIGEKWKYVEIVIVQFCATFSLFCVMRLT